jgi:hypothetical protein
LGRVLFSQLASGTGSSPPSDKEKAPTRSPSSSRGSFVKGTVAGNAGSEPSRPTRPVPPIAAPSQGRPSNGRLPISESETSSYRERVSPRNKTRDASGTRTAAPGGGEKHISSEAPDAKPPANVSSFASNASDDDAITLA